MSNSIDENNIAKEIGKSLLIDPKHLELAKALNPIYKEYQRALNSYYASIPQWISAINDELLQYKSILEHIEKKLDWDALLQSYELWGDYGWAVIGHAYIKFHFNPPKDQIDADKKALGFFKIKDLILLWKSLKEMPFSKQEINDINESINCFKYQNYKACTMVICALIDGIGIKLQHDNEIRLKVGKKAISGIEKRLTKTWNSNTCFSYLSCKNLLKCLYRLYDGNNFENEPNAYNRNYIFHGMSMRKVLRKDCIKLYLILYNLKDYIDAIK